MIGVYAHAVAKPEHAADFEKLARELTEKSRAEDGVVSYEFGPAADDAKGEFAFIERWESIEALEAHMMTEHYIKADTDCQPYLATPMQISIYEIQE